MNYVTMIHNSLNKQKINAKLTDVRVLYTVKRPVKSQKKKIVLLPNGRIIRNSNSRGKHFINIMFPAALQSWGRLSF